MEYKNHIRLTGCGFFLYRGCDKLMGTSKNKFSSRWREILSQILCQKSQEYWMSFKIFESKSWGKRAAIQAERSF